MRWSRHASLTMKGSRCGSARNVEPPSVVAEMLRVLFVLGLVVVAPVPGNAQGLAWWITWSLRPMSRTIEGLAVETLDPSWRRAALIRPDDLPIASTKPGEGLEDSGVRLAVEADIDGDGQPERAVVGVFDTSRGELGRFLLILDRSGRAQPWRKRALFQVRGGNTFSAVAVKNTVLTWYGCLECNDQCAVVLVGTELRLRCLGQ